MSDITAAVVTPAPIRGRITPPPSKSAAHRLLLAAALSRLGAPGRDSTVRGILPSDDMEATLRLLAGLGIPFSRQGDTVRFSGVPRRPAGTVEADCGESGSTLRFLIPVYAALGVPARFTGRGRLPARPLGMKFTNDGGFANLMMHPSHGVSKLYRVTVRPRAEESQIIALSKGVTLDDGSVTQPAVINVVVDEPGRTVMEMTIKEGKNRQIRRMCEAVGLEVIRLRRSAMGAVKLGMLQPGQYRELTKSEVAALRAAAQKGKARSQTQRAQEAAEQRREHQKKRSTAPSRPSRPRRG